MRGRQRAWKIAGVIVAVLVLAVLICGLAVRHRLVASLPRLDGEVRVADLGDRVSIARDTLGVPTITAASRLDASFALGFLHAQERFFQMDLQRRRSAGELAALFGRGLLPIDRDVRVHRFRARASRVLEALSEDERREAEAYTRGVNAGLAALAAPPFEYMLLRAQPEPWRPEDTVLVIDTMFLELQDGRGEHEATLGLLHDTLPESLAVFLDVQGTEWDAAVDGSTFAPPPIPSPAVLDLRRSAGEARAPDELRRAAAPEHTSQLSAAETESQRAATAGGEDFARGSNNWAISARVAADGHAWVAGDMHLSLTVPNIWYRAVLVYPDSSAANGRRTVTGVTLPGAPALIAGSNGDVAWTFTNSETDASDLVLLEMLPAGPDVYRTPGGPEQLAHFRERIRVHGGREDSLDVAESRWGPVVGRDFAHRPLALHWMAHDPAGVNFRLLEMEHARDLGAALALAPACGIPAQNCVVADRAGHIGWTIMGILPRRVGFDGRLPASWADGTRRWDGVQSPASYPRIVDPPAGRIWTANQRVVGGEMLASLGDAGYGLGARARQIRDDLLALPAATPQDLHRIQLDDRAIFLERWHDLLLRALTPAAIAADPRRGEMRRLVEAWGERAAVESVGYRIVRTFRSVLADEVLAGITSECRRADSSFSVGSLPQREGPVWRLLEAQPAHLLNHRYASWDAQILAAADSTRAQLTRGGSSLATSTWGERNTAHIQHPLSHALPMLARWLDMPRHALAGDSNMPRVQSPAGGASQRLVVSPGNEAAGFFEMPCGQSGHPLSPHYRDGHAAWEEGRPMPFLPGTARHTLVLVPQASGARH